jgi:hypothetical protein
MQAKKNSQSEFVGRLEVKHCREGALGCFVHQPASRSKQDYQRASGWLNVRERSSVGASVSLVLD